MIAELLLRSDGRYADLVEENLIYSRAIWDRPKNDTQYRSHPDLEYDIEIIFNDFGIRNHKGVTKKTVLEFDGKLVGVFGDSMTENRRIEDRFSFTSILDEYLFPDFRVLNFGVDGYGPDQAYLKYIDFEPRAKLDYVLYVFVQNDLRNIYENQLFRFSDGELVEPVAPEPKPMLEFIRQFHVTYMVIDGYSRIKAQLSRKPYEVDGLNDQFNRNVSRDIVPGRQNRFHDAYADSMVQDLLSDNPNPDTKLWAARFNQIVREWKTDVERHGNEFYILVTPNRTATDLSTVLFDPDLSEVTFHLGEEFPEGYGSFTFQNDNHWNERGNLRAAQAIRRWGGAAGFWVLDNRRWSKLEQEVVESIQNIYGKAKQ